MNARMAVSCAWLALAASGAFAQSAVAVVDASASAASLSGSLSPPGELWLRFGVLDMRGGESRQRTSLPVRAIYAYTETVGMRIDFEPWAHLARHDGTTASGVTDPTVLLRLSRALPAGQTVTFEAGAKFSVAPGGLTSGRNDAVTNLIYGREFDPYYLEASFGYSRLGTAGRGESRNEFPWYVDLYRTLTPDWTATLEFSGTNRSGTRPILEMLGALGYRLAPQMIVVGKVAFGLTDRAPDRTIGCNFILTFR